MPRVTNFNREILKLVAERMGGNITVEFPKLTDWLSGGPYPTVKQLAEFAKAVHIPFGYFFLDKLPELKTGVPLFRTEEALPSENYSDELRDSIRIIQSRQEWLKEYLLNEGATPLPFVNSFNETDNPLEVAQKIRDTLQLLDDWAGSMPNWEKALKYLLDKVEEAGIYLAINGVVENNTHRPLNPDEFRGFVLTDNYAPYIFINGKDFTAAKWQAFQKKQKPGGDFYNTQHYRVGKLFFRQVLTAAKEGKLLYPDAYKLSGLYGQTFSRFESEIFSTMGFVEGLNNKTCPEFIEVIRVIQRRAYGLRDEEYLRLKILTCMLKKI